MAVGDVLVSVIAPMYNAEETIGALMDSYLAVSTDHDEMLIVDDGSTDGSADVVASYAELHPGIRLIRTPNRGRSHARNLGINEARGTWVVFADSDDRLLPVPLEEYPPTTPGVDVCVSHVSELPPDLVIGECFGEARSVAPVSMETVCRHPNALGVLHDA